MENRKQFNVCDSLIKCANEILPKLIENEIKISYNKDKSAFIANNAGEFKIENLVWDSLGDFSANESSYRPRYLIKRKYNDDESEDVYVDVEALDSEIKFT